MNWNEWYRQYESLPSLQARLKIVSAQIAAALGDCPADPLRIVSICAGDGRDVIDALMNHARRGDVRAILLDSHSESIRRGRAAAEQAGLAGQVRFVEADATLAANYDGLVPADLVLLSGFLGHLRVEDVPGFIASLPMLCKTGGWAIWSRHLVMNQGREQVPAIRELLRRQNFQEAQFETASPNGFAVGRARFAGTTQPLDASRVLFEFVGLDRLLPLAESEDGRARHSVRAEENSPDVGAQRTDAPYLRQGIEVEERGSLNGRDAADPPDDTAQTIPTRFAEMVRLHSTRVALGAGAWRPTYSALDAATNRLASVILSRGGAAGDRVAILMRHDSPLIAATLAVLKAGRVVVVLNPSEPPSRLRQILDDAEPRAIVTDEANRALAKQIAQPAHEILGFEEASGEPPHEASLEFKLQLAREHAKAWTPTQRHPTVPGPKARPKLEGEPRQSSRTGILPVSGASSPSLLRERDVHGQDAHGDRLEACPTTTGRVMDVTISPHDMAWLIYTSGSTGQPKGVIQTHRNIVHNVRRLSRGLGLRAEDRLTLLASPSGGQGVSTIWCALLNGAALCPFPIRETGLPGLGAWLKEHQITILIATASVFRHFTQTLGEAEFFPSVRAVRLASEPATAADYAKFQKHFADDCLLLNTLSSSETGNITQHRITRGDRIVEGRLPVGRAAEGMEVVLLDERGREVGDGETGEIVVRSRFISPGYWRNDALTAERFSGGCGPDDLRLFHSGDLGRRTPDGALVFMDRKDTRVKVHGYRVEPSEIEEALLRQPNVDGALVGVRTGTNGDKQLIAHVVMRGGKAVAPETLRRALRASLPAHMVPSAFVFLNQFPLTPHGKIDRQALPAPPPPEAQARRGRVLKPRDVVERNLARIWESVLGISPIGRDDDFFDLGGTSLQAVEVLVSIEEVFDVALPASALVEHSTVERLAPLLSDHAVIPSLRPLVVLRDAPRGRPLFFIHSGQGDVVTYGLLVRRLAERPMFGLQAVGVQGESWPLMSVPAMAERYLPEILEKDPTGPYLLAGTCMGGMVAFELAQRLVRMSRTVNLLALLDVPTAPYSGRRPIWHEAVLDPLRDLARMLRWGLTRASGLKTDGHRLPAYRRFVAGMTGLSNRRYRPVAYPGTITLMLTEQTEFAAGDRRRLIARFARETRTIMIPGDRPGLFVRPGVEELAHQFQVCLDEVEGKSAARPRSASALELQFGNPARGC